MTKLKRNRFDILHDLLTHLLNAKIKGQVRHDLNLSSMRIRPLLEKLIENEYICEIKMPKYKMLITTYKGMKLLEMIKEIRY